MANARKQLETAVFAVGGSVMFDKNAEWIDVILDAPDRMIWNASSTHYLSDMGKPGAGAVGIICARLLQDAREGVRPCDNVNCDVCEDLA
jgi:hypothetical protein